MKYYALDGYVNNKYIHVSKPFASRNAAIDYMFKVYSRHWKFDVQVETEIAHSKHDIEYVCDSGDRFTVRRMTL